MFTNILGGIFLGKEFSGGEFFLTIVRGNVGSSNMGLFFIVPYHLESAKKISKCLNLSF